MTRRPGWRAAASRATPTLFPLRTRCQPREKRSAVAGLPREARAGGTGASRFERRAGASVAGQGAIRVYCMRRAVKMATARMGATRPRGPG